MQKKSSIYYERVMDGERLPREQKPFKVFTFSSWQMSQVSLQLGDIVGVKKDLFPLFIRPEPITTHKSMNINWFRVS